MEEETSKYHEIDYLLNGLTKKPNLKELFDQKLSELNIAQSTALGVLDIEYRALVGILNGSLKRVDFANLIKIATFLQISKEEVIRLYIEELEKNFLPETASTPDKIMFIKENFDLAELRRAGMIDSLTEFDKIENVLNGFLGLKSILDYKRPTLHVAFSSGKLVPKNELTRSLWIESATIAFEEISNPYEYNRQAVVDYFPNIRWHSTDVELGLLNIIKELFKMGVTIIYQAPFPSLHLRGATFSVHEKPCIVLTNYKGYYPTLWFALIHELFHVLFDWDEIKNLRYHLTDDDTDQLSVRAKEEEADNFAREYLFSKEKTKKIKPFISDSDFVEEYALNNHVHPSFVYVFHAYDLNNRTAWAIAKINNPNSAMKKLLDPLDNNWRNPKPISDFIKTIKPKLYN